MSEGALTVSVIVPTYNEEQHLATTLASVRAQGYPGIVEILVADGRSTDATRQIAAATPGVRVVDNPRRIQAAGLNAALAVAVGDVIVRVDGHCVLDRTYVERCVDALQRTSAAIVGGGMSPSRGRSPLERAIAEAMSSRVGAGPARFHTGGTEGWVDTVYLGAYRRVDALAVGGYAEDVGVNEDSEFAIRMAPRGGVFFDPTIRSEYVPRPSIRAVARQFHKYGRSRAATVRRHPGSLRLRQLAAPILVVGLLSPWRAKVLAGYGALIAGRVAMTARRDREAAPRIAAVLPTMHLAWGLGFLRGVLSPPHSPAVAMDSPECGEREWPSLDWQPEPHVPGAEPGANPVSPDGLSKGAGRPRTRMDDADGPGQVLADHEQSVL